ncbi:MAG: hypothetical protein K6D59_02930 [Bacteroidales bacterium]|nr:hypothetical protein [Bacteroidales bacterium]
MLTNTLKPAVEMGVVPLSIAQEQNISALLYRAITNVPWKEMCNVMPPPSKEIQNLAEIAFQKISPGNITIDFEADTWDLTPFAHLKKAASLPFNFLLVPKPERNTVKLFELYDIATTRNISTCKSNYFSLSEVLRACYTEGHCRTIKDISVAEIIAIIEKEDIAHITKVYKGNIMKRFLVFDATIHRKKISDTELRDLDMFLKKERSLYMRSKRLRKYPSIPQELVTIIQRKALTVMTSPKEPQNMRTAACAILTQIWLGLRPIELALLRKTDFHQETVCGRVMPYCLYRSPKNRMKSFPIYCFPLAAQAIQTALQLAKEYGDDASQDMFYIIRDTTPLPVTSKSLSRLINSFYYKYLKDKIQFPWDGISPHRIKNQLVYTPTLYQYRVHLCTYLYDKGVSRSWIEQNMSHLDSLSYGYYYRREDELRQKDRENVTRFIEQVVNDNLTPLGCVGPQLLKDINTTAIQVEGDIDAIVKNLGKKYRLRTLAFGICAKAAVSRCKGETEYEKLLCAYGDCSKIVYTIQDLPEAYLRFQNLIKTYEANKNNGRENAAMKELYILKRFISNRISLEVRQLKKEIKEYGHDYVMKKYPSIAELHLDLRKLEHDIALWKRKTN